MDKRSGMQKKLDGVFGMPLYYCADCLLAVDVKPVNGGEPIIKRPCNCDAQILAPRQAIVIGKGGMNAKIKLKILVMQLIAYLTGRSK